MGCGNCPISKNEMFHEYIYIYICACKKCNMHMEVGKSHMRVLRLAWPGSGHELGCWIAHGVLDASSYLSGVRSSPWTWFNCGAV